MAEINPLVNALQGANRPVYQQPGLGSAQRQQQLANILLQSGQRTNNPIVAGLMGYFGTDAALGAAEKFGALEQAQMKAEQERLARQEGREERKIDLSEREIEQRGRLEAQKLAAQQAVLAQENMAKISFLKSQGYTPEQAAQLAPIISDTAVTNRLFPKGADTVVNVNTGATAKEELAKNIGKKQAEQLFDEQAKAIDARRMIEANQEARQLLTGGIKSGTGAEFRLEAAKAMNLLGASLGLELADEQEIANTEAFLASRATAVAGIIKNFGAGTGLSDADREFAAKAAAGKIEMNESSIKRILDITDKMARSTITAYNKKASNVPEELRVIPLDVEIPKQTIFFSEEAAEAADLDKGTKVIINGRQAVIE